MKFFKLFLIFLFIFSLNCAVSKREKIPFWEENSFGEFEIYYFIGSVSGKAKGFMSFEREVFSFKVVGPLNFNILSIRIYGEEVEISYKDEVFREKLCPPLEVKNIISYFNGKKDVFPPFFSCYGWNLSFDGEGGSVRGTRGGEMFFFYNTTDKPIQKFSLEYFKEDLSINGKLKGIYRLP